MKKVLAIASLCMSMNAFSMNNESECENIFSAGKTDFIIGEARLVDAARQYRAVIDSRSLAPHTDCNEIEEAKYNLIKAEPKLYSAKDTLEDAIEVCSEEEVEEINFWLGHANKALILTGKFKALVYDFLNENCSPKNP